ncbi:MAG: 5-bromo-4-chloroindolyl phosphate hydrolysis family protein [Olegusella sp.]|nr:5-bromo-4-chloroindolyl phosphate hydrolysis family protein [Olegusella sp.]
MAQSTNQQGRHYNSEPSDEPTYEVPDQGYPTPGQSFGRAMNDLGNAVADKVNDAVNAADFTGLASSVSNSIRSAANSLSMAMGQPSTAIVRAPGKKNAANVQRFVFTPLSVGSWVLGVICALACFTGAGFEVLVVGAVFMGLGALFGAKGKKATHDYKLHRGLDQFARIAGPREQVTVEELASRSGFSMAECVDTINEGIRAGYIPHGRLRGTTSGQTMLYLTDGAFHRAGGVDTPVYRHKTSERVGDRNQTTPQPDPHDAAAEQAASEVGLTGLDPRIQQIVSEGNAYLVKIHHANDVIEEAEMSDKLARLETVVRRIIVGVHDHPETAGDLGQFMGYYLPTTGKLVDAYVDLEQHGDHGPNAEATRREIKATLDVINDSFEKLSDDMLQDQAWDLQSDMSVLRTMLRQDGLADDGGPRADENRPLA